VCYLSDQVFGEDHTCYEELRVLFVRLFDLGIISCLPYLFMLILYIVWTQSILLIIHKIVISCVEIYMYCCSDIDSS